MWSLAEKQYFWRSILQSLWSQKLQQSSNLVRRVVRTEKLRHRTQSGYRSVAMFSLASFVHWSNNSLLQSRPWIHVAFAHSRLPSEVHPFQRWSSHSLRPILILRISLSLSYVYYLLLHLLLPALESMHSINAWCKVPREHNVQRFLVGSWIFVHDYCWCYCHYPGGCSSNWHRSFRALQAHTHE